MGGLLSASEALEDSGDLTPPPVTEIVVFFLVSLVSFLLFPLFSRKIDRRYNPATLAPRRWEEPSNRQRS